MQPSTYGTDNHCMVDAMRRRRIRVDNAVAFHRFG